MTRNLDPDTVRSFGDEWSRFEQSRLSPDEARAIFNGYFAVFPWDALPPVASGFAWAAVPGAGRGWWRRVSAICIASILPPRSMSRAMRFAT